MSRLGHRRSLTVAAATLAALVAPAAANATTYTIKSGDGACGGADLACGGFAEAAAAAAAGDVFDVTAGSYPGANFTAPALTIKGAAGVLVNSTLQFSAASGAASKVSKIAVVQPAATGPGVLVTGGHAGLELSDAVVVSANDHGIFVSAGSANKIVRTIAATGGAQSSAIQVESDAGTPAKNVTIESTLTSGGAAGIGAKTRSALVEAGAGAITLDLRHVTAAGSSHGIRLDSSQAQGLTAGVGSITATVSDSITLANAATNYPGVAGLGANSATIDATRTLLTGDKAALFADPARGNYRLRPGSPAIGQGAVTPGESTTDIDGEDRSTAPTDLGADEFSNAAPVAKIAVQTATPRAGQAVTFDGAGSTDREAAYGGGIAEYRWTFSDGRTETTHGPVVSHTFAKAGDAAAQLVVVDRQGAASAPATVHLKLVDGTPPTIAIVTPKNNQKIRVFTTKTTTRTVNGVKKKTKRRTRTKIVFGGLSGDTSGVAGIALTLEKIGKKTTKTRCYWFNPRKGVLRKSCQRPVLFAAKLEKDSTTGEWSYTVKRNLSKGSYKLTAVGIDKAGASGNAGGSKLGVVKFRLI